VDGIAGLGSLRFRLSAQQPAISSDPNGIRGACGKAQMTKPPRGRPTSDYLVPIGEPEISGKPEISGAGEGIRTLDPDLGKVVLYH
jgi:hypothetical protein